MTTPDRKPRCRVLDRQRNPCPNEEITEGFCLRHLRLAAGEWARLVRNAVDAFPQLAQLAQEDEPA